MSKKLFFSVIAALTLAIGYAGGGSAQPAGIEPSVDVAVADFGDEAMFDESTQEAVPESICPRNFKCCAPDLDNPGTCGLCLPRNQPC